MDKALVVNVRLATLDDLDALMCIETASFYSDQIGRRQMRYLLSKAKAVTYVVTVDELVVGYATTLLPASPRPARLYTLAVLPEHRGKGLAKVLVETMKNHLRQLKYSRWRLEVDTTNQGAIELYQKAGFETIKHLPYYYLNGHHHGWRMEARVSEMEFDPIAEGYSFSRALG